MADRKIVLVLGAGASIPYGFPSGRDLVDDICENYPQNAIDMESSSGLQQRTRARASHFVNRLRHSRRCSIDTFLRDNPDLHEEGKTAIASVLLKREQKSPLLYPDDKEDWYRHLFNWLADDQHPNFANKHLAIITYNYDRSLEHYLFTALTNSYQNVDTNAARQLINQVPIVHVHGQLAQLPWQSSGGGTVSYGGKSRQDILEAASGIKVIYEDIHKDPAIKQAHDLLKQARVLLFLGFGYDRDNLESLNLSEVLPTNASIAGTAFDMTEKELIPVKRQLRRLAPPNKRLNSPGLLNCNNMEFIRETVHFQRV